MSDHGATLTDLPADGEIVDVSKFSKIIRVSGFVGLLTLVASLGIIFFGGHSELGKTFSYSWLFACYFFFTIAVGGLFWVLLHNVSNSGWGVAIRRIMEHLSNMLPYVFILFIPILFLQDPSEALYEWMLKLRIADENGVEPEYLLKNKAPYLTMGFFYFRFFAYAVSLSGIAWLMRRWSVGQDKTGDIRPTFWARRASAGFVPVFAVCSTFMAFDLLMGLDWTWFSTMWGVYIFAGSALSSMAVMILTITFLRSRGYMKKVVTLEHYHIMGKFMFAFTVFWAYISFSQFFLYWYANVTEETKFYIIRNTEGWHYLSIFLVFGHFVMPFAFLLRQKAKKDMRQICGAACWVLLVHFIDIYWIIMPERGPSITQYLELYPAGAQITIPYGIIFDIFAFVSVGSIMLWAYLRSMGNYSIYPSRDPRLLESARLVN
ncbi:MAG: hypothetical protein CMO38_02885 [Verrucomicrobiaceae bacterium]|nr:hypothetical protein [Verrucomicrobiaceae bacterium]